MSQALPIPPAGFDALSVDDKIDYVQSLWDRIAARPEDVPVPDWHREIINERLGRASSQQRSKQTVGRSRKRNHG
jgi:hypothetical protein